MELLRRTFLIGESVGLKHIALSYKLPDNLRRERLVLEPEGIDFTPTFPFPKKTLCVSVFYHLWVVYCVLQSFIFLNGVLLYRKALYIALASVGLLHILNFSFSPKAFIASVVTAFCVDIILTISVQ